jgi:hypothetical protein
MPGLLAIMISLVMRKGKRSGDCTGLLMLMLVGLSLGDIVVSNLLNNLCWTSVYISTVEGSRS